MLSILPPAVEPRRLSKIEELFLLLSRGRLGGAQEITKDSGGPGETVGTTTAAEGKDTLGHELVGIGEGGG